MGQLLSHWGPRRLRRSGALIALGLGLAGAAELALVALAPGQHLVVNDIQAPGLEVRDLPAGTHGMAIVADDGRVVQRHLVLLSQDERVVIDLQQLLSPEVERGPMPDRSAPPPAPESQPQWLVVGAIEREAVRVHVDGKSVPFDPLTQTYRVQLTPGPHVMERYVAGGRRPPHPFVVHGKPWRCAVERTGNVFCVEVPPLDPDAAYIDAVATRELLAQTPPERRLAALADLTGVLTCMDVAALFNDFLGDESRLKVALLLRPQVRDPWNFRVISDALSFPDAQRTVIALYGGFARPSDPQATTALPD